MDRMMHDIEDGAGKRKPGELWAGIALLLLFTAFFIFHSASPRFLPNIETASMGAPTPSKMPVLEPYSGTKIVSRSQGGPKVPRPDDDTSHSLNVPLDEQNTTAINNTRAMYVAGGTVFISYVRACGRYPRAPPAFLA